MNPAAVFDHATRCLLALRGPRGPLILPMAHWFDGAAVWMTTAAGSAKVEALRADPACVIGVPATASRADARPVEADGPPAVVAPGQARVFTAAEPMRLALHAPAIGGALSALAARNVNALVDYATNAPEIPLRWALRHRVVIRVAIEAPTARSAPPPSGIGPALPTVLPADLRRRLGGIRTVMVAWDDPPLAMVPATWTTEFRLAFPAEGPRPREGGRVAVVLDADVGRPIDAVGCVLRGTFTGDALAPETVTWWRGFEVRRRDVLASPADAAAD